MARVKNYFTFHDKTNTNSTGNEWIVEQELSNFAVLDSDVLTIEISGTATSGTTYFEAKVTPDGNYNVIAGARASDYEISTFTNGINEFWMFEIGSYYSIRFRVENVSNGYITIKSKICKNN